MGVPQGGPLSPVLANVVLDELDWELERRGHRFARYTTLAAFVSQFGDLVATLFAQVLLICDRQGLIGRDLNRDVLMSRCTRMCASDDVRH